MLPVYFLQADALQTLNADNLDLQALRSSVKPNKYFWSKEYLAKSAKAKQADLWDAIKADTKSGSFPSKLELPGVFIESMAPSFDGKGDAMPKGKLFGNRKKYIHSVGTVGKVKFVSEPGNKYSGIFKGADYGLVRFSTAAAPDKSQPLAPGLGLKFLRDGTDSANMVSMWSVAGQPNDWNFFSNDFFNHIVAGPPDNKALGLLSAKFSKETDYIQQVGLADFAEFDQAGKQTVPNMPFSLRFEPTSDVKTLFPTALQNNDYMSYVKQLTTVPANSKLYKIYAFDKSNLAGGKEQLIGTLVLDGELTTSKWGDEDLYFRHQRMTDDLKYHPEWDQYLEKHSDNGKGCPYLQAMGLI